MSCEGVYIKSVTQHGVTLVLEGWHPTTAGDRDDDCSLCGREAETDREEHYYLYEISQVENGVAECLTDGLMLSERPSDADLWELMEKLAAKDEDGVSDILDRLAGE